MSNPATQPAWTPLSTTSDDPEQSAASPSTAARQRIQWLHGARLVLGSAAWLAASSGIIIANRYIMVELNWPYPMAVAAMGMAVSGLFGFIVCDVLKMVPAADITLTFYATRVLPIGALQAMAMWLSNTLYLLLTVAFIEMCRALLPLFIMLALYASNLETPTATMVKAVSLTGVGCMMAAYGEVRLSAAGLLCLFGNFGFEAGRLVLMQVLLVGHEFHALQGLKLIAPASVLCLGAMSLATEYPRMVANDAFGIAARNWPLFLVAASAGLCVNLISNVIIKMAGSTALKVLSAVRGPLVVLSGVFLFMEHVSPLELVGYSIALVGFVWYNYAKSLPVPKVPAKSTSSSRA